MQITKKELYNHKTFYLDKIRKGAVFIYPTDTIYGIGCNARISASVERIRNIKKRPKTPLSVIAPSKEWILKNCIVSDSKILDKLPGPYTLILKLKHQCVAKNVNPSLKTLGIRIPKHWISRFVAELNSPLVTTSVNKAGERHMVSLKELDRDIKNSVDFIIYEGIKDKNPSAIVDCTENKSIKRNNI